MNFNCEYCNKTFSTKGTLKTHQKSAKFCLELQQKIIDNFICEYCNKSITTKYNLDLHYLKCKVKENYIKDSSYNASQKQIKMEYEVKLNDKEQIIENLNIDLKYKNLEIDKLRNEIREYKDQIADLLKTAISKPTSTSITHNNKTNNSTNNNNSKNIDARTLNMIPLNIKPEILSEKLEKNFTLNHLLKGQKGVAEFLLENVLITGEKNDKKYLMKCTDPARKVFQYLDDEGNLQKDINAQNLTELIHDPVKERSVKLHNEIWDQYRNTYSSTGDDLEEESEAFQNLQLEQEKATFASEKVCDISAIKSNNSEMVKHLIPKLSC